MPVVLILGAGANIGQAVARTFAGHGYRVALAARSLDEADSSDAQLHIRSDLAAADGVAHAFDRTTRLLGIPSVVVYNASVATFTPPDDPLALPLEALQRDAAVNVTSAFDAAQRAAAGFAQLPPAAARTFVYTGNVLNTAVLPAFVSPGMGKSAAAHMVHAAADAYKERGYKFYYADERKADGSPKYRVDGDAHGRLYYALAQGPKQGPWLQTFVDGVYTPFGN